MKIRERRIDGSLLVSIALHVVVGAALFAILSIPNPIRQWLMFERGQKPQAEQISYVAIPSAGSAVARSGGDNVPVRGKKRSTPFVAPTTIPTAVPPAPASNEPASGEGPVVGGGGPGEGVTPSYGDPRVWAPTGPIYYAPKSQAERLDSAIQMRVFAHNDSMAMYNSGKKPGDWTFEKNGEKYGMDQQKIYLGKLALLPLNVQGNPARYQNDRMKESQRQEIYQNAQRAMDNDEFKIAVKEIRQRKDREHKAELAAKHAQQQSQQQAQQDQQTNDQSSPPAPPPPPPPPQEPAQIP